MSDQIRIVAGSFKQRLIKTPKGSDTRPTSSKVREAIFSMLLNDIPDAVVLDLFAGSGALSFEAISRGAKRAVLCDSGHKAIAAIKENIKALNVSAQTQVLPFPWPKALLHLSQENQKFDVIFLDPPYALDVSPVLEKIFAYTLLAKHAIICVEHGQSFIVPDGLSVIKSKQYGQTGISFITEDNFD
ncbi:MAG: 16S rRNA (guanine(966)-N(2))-methyltransferase RsmD [Eubacteriales bacterium]|nr:16S rRNA (guanine(966)-N(2))-methyltransferase RsmD [Eubacteriales bacterium]